MSDGRIQPCTQADLAEVAALVNAAYRAEGGQSGWTSEVGLVEGRRVTLNSLEAEHRSVPGLLIGTLREEAGLLACIRVEATTGRRGEPACYIGMLAVRPASQGGGVGRRMLAWAEQQACLRGVRTARMTVVSVRTALIEWYERSGYRRTGETEPFPYDDERFGTPLRPGLEFVFLEKELPA